MCFVGARYIVWTTTEHSNSQTASKQFNAVIQTDADALRDQFEVYADTLYSGRALFLADGSVTRQAWSNFVEAQYISQRYPGVDALGYASVISRNQATELVAELNRSRLPTEHKPFSIYPASHDATLAVMQFIAPSSHPQQAIGFDLLTSPIRKQALDVARDTGSPRTSAPLTLIGNSSKAPPSVLLVIPVYNSSNKLTTVAGRQAAIEGYVIMSLHTQPMLDSIFKSKTPADGLAVTASDGGVIYRHSQRSAGQVLQKSVNVDIAGQTWQLDFTAPTDFGLSTAEKIAPTMIFLSAIPLAAVLALLLYYATRLQGLREHHRDFHHSDSDEKQH
jgi:CHASE1-domain containing sensor protein